METTLKTKIESLLDLCKMNKDLYEKQRILDSDSNEFKSGMYEGILFEIDGFIYHLERVLKDEK